MNEASNQNKSGNNEAEPGQGNEKKGKGLNFMNVVIAALVTIILVILIALFVLHKDGGKLVPHGPNPEPNSRLSYPGAVPGKLATC